MSLGLQYVVIVLAVLASALYVLHHRAPLFSRRLRVALALPLIRESRPAWLRALGRRIAPPSKAGSECGSCDTCTPR